MRAAFGPIWIFGRSGEEGITILTGELMMLSVNLNRMVKQGCIRQWERCCYVNFETSEPGKTCETDETSISYKVKNPRPSAAVQFLDPKCADSKQVWTK